MKVYRSFANNDVRNQYFCKSEINSKLLNELNLYDLISVQEAKVVFDKLARNNDKSIVVTTGNRIDKNKRRHTRYVLKRVFYQEVINHLL